MEQIGEETETPAKQGDYKAEIDKIIKSLPRYLIRRFFHLTKTPNPKHVNAYEDICKIVEEEINKQTLEYQEKTSQLEKENSDLSTRYNQAEKRIDAFGIIKGMPSFKEDEEEHKEFW